jgi:hypothetical protein
MAQAKRPQVEARLQKRVLKTRGQQIEKREDASPSIMSPQHRLYQMRG